MVRRVVVIDDDPAFLRLMRDVLPLAACEAIGETDPQLALALIRTHRPDLAIIDLRFKSEPAGIRIIDEIRADPDLRDLPIMACSADVQLLRERAEWLRARGCTVMEKPFDLDDFLAIVRRTMDQS